jgi:hypothetical protein
MANYTVYDEGKTRHGDARDVLEQIRLENGRDNDEVARMNVDEYARALIDDAPYFLPSDLLKVLGSQPFDSDIDRALTYLGQMPTSGVRILAVK